MIRRIGAAMFVSLLAMTACMAGPARPAQAAAPIVPAAGFWYYDVENAPVGPLTSNSWDDGNPATGAGTAAVNDGWDFWGPNMDGGSVVSAAAEGLPAAPNGDKVLKWTKTPSMDDYGQKWNRTFTDQNWPAGSPAPVAASDSPADVSGRYIVNEYVDSSQLSITGHNYLVLSEFKENYRTAGVWAQDPTWGFSCQNFVTVNITCALSGGDETGRPRIALSSLMDSWVNFEYRLYQGARDTSGHGGRIELWINGVLFDTGWQGSTTGAPKVGSAAFSSLADTDSWVWIAGQYTSNQYTDASGTVYNEPGPGRTPDTSNINVVSYVDASAVKPLPATAGLTGTYFNNTTVTGTPALTRTDPAINFSWGNGSPGTGVNQNNFSARWTGYVTVPTTGTYFWCTRSDDGSRVWVNGVQVVNAWSNHTASPPTCAATAQTLTAGVQYPLTMEYYDATGTATAAFGYKMTVGATDVQTPAGWLSH